MTVDYCAKIAANHVRDGNPTRGIRLVGIPLLPLEIHSASLVATQSNSSEQQDMNEETELLYLGQSDGTHILVDHEAGETLRVPAGSVIVRIGPVNRTTNLNLGRLRWLH